MGQWPLMRLASLAFAVVACGSLGPSPAPTRMAGLLELPSISIDFEGCPGVGLGDNAVLAGNPADARVAWVNQGSSRLDVVFPPWLGARFAPTLEIVAPDGEAIARAGDRIGGGCVTGGDPASPLLILWP